MTHVPPFPELEILLLASTIERAVDLALAGIPAQGYRELEYGLERAQAAEAEPWGQTLAARYAAAVGNFTQRFLFVPELPWRAAPATVAIPRHELTVLAMSEWEAHDLAEAGETYDGWRCLLGGEARAREAIEFREPWGEALLQRYRQALDEYGERFGIRPE